MRVRPAPAAPSTPEALMDLFRDHVHARDVDGLLGLYEPAAVFEPEPGTVVRGHDEIRAALTALVSLAPTMEVVPRQVLVADDVALVVNEWTMVGTGPGGETVRKQGRSADVVRRQADGSWRVLIDRP